MTTVAKTILVALMMIAAIGIVVAGDSEETDAAAGPAGTMNVYMYDDSENGSWSKETKSAYNALLALTSTSYYDATTDSVVTNYTYEYTYDGVIYKDIQSTYGTITELMDTPNTETSKWNVLVYIDADGDGEGGFDWAVGADAIGWYKPFTDYAEYIPAYGTANIALYYGASSDSETMISSLETAISGDSTLATQGLTSIDKTQGSVFEHTFYLKNIYGTPVINPGTVVTTNTYTEVSLSIINLNLGITVVGYGSDMMLALIDAIGTSNVSFVSTTNPVPGYNSYGWMDTMFGMGTSYTDGVYHYWASYTTYVGAGSSSNVLAELGTGAYSALTNAPATQGYMAFVYE